MKTILRRFASVLSAFVLCAGVAHAIPSPGVQYNPKNKTVQGNQPLSESYPVTITTPNSVAAGSNLTIGFSITVSSAPSGVSEATALSFIAVSPSTLTVTGPSQTKVVTITVTVPEGSFAGDYAYVLKTTGWPTNLNVTDAGTTVNMRVTPNATVDTSPPTVNLQDPSNGETLTYYPAVGPLEIPVLFEAQVGDNGAPVDSMKAFLGSTPLSLTETGLNTLSASATAVATVTAPGIYTISVEATNIYGTGYDSADVTVVVSAPPPSITVASPTAGAQFIYPAGGTSATVPVSFTATSVYGNVTQVAATLDGTPITLSSSGPGTTITSSATLNLVAGDYTLVFNAASDYGTATPVVVPIKVRTQAPEPVLPVVSILAPTAGQVFSRTAGDPATVVSYSFTATSASGPVTAVVVAIDGVAQTPVLTGSGTASVTGAGTISYTAGGSHTLTVTATNADGSATASTNFSIQQAPAPVCRNLYWLPPISLDNTVEGGSTMPIKFTLTCKGSFVRDTAVLIAIYEVYADGSFGDPVIYPYGANGNPNPPDYAINGHHYQLNFDTAKGVHRYRIEVYRPLADGSFQVLGTKDLLTKRKSGQDRGDRDNDCGDHRDRDNDRDRNGDNDRGKDKDRDHDKDRDKDNDRDGDKGKGRK